MKLVLPLINIVSNSWYHCYPKLHSVQYSLQDTNKKHNLDWIWKVCLTGPTPWSIFPHFVAIWEGCSKITDLWNMATPHVSCFSMPDKCLLKVLFFVFCKHCCFFSPKLCLSCECMWHGFCFCFLFRWVCCNDLLLAHFLHSGFAYGRFVNVSYLF